MPIGQSLYVFGNSLFNHEIGVFTPRTNVGYWLNQFARAAGDSFEISGGYGFLRDFAYSDRFNDPQSGAYSPSAWGFPGTPNAWFPERADFAGAGFDTVLITPANFIQWQSPDSDYWDQPVSPQEAAIDLVTAVQARDAQVAFAIYQGWAPFDAFGYPPDAQGFAAWRDYNRGDYHDWYVDFVAGIGAAHPGLSVQLLPVAHVLAGMLDDPSLGLTGVAATDLFVDDAPHGTETLYFLAALITHRGLFGTSVDPGFAVPDGIHPSVAANLDVLEAYIAEELAAFGFAPTSDLTGNLRPDAADDHFDIAEDLPVALDVFANDSDANGDRLALINPERLDQPDHGSVYWEAGLLWYDPDDGFAGTDGFAYDITDGRGGSDSARVSLTVAGQGDPPPATVAAVLDLETAGADGDTVTQDAFVFVGAGLITREDGATAGQRAVRGTDDTLVIARADGADFAFERVTVTAVQGDLVTLTIEGFAGSAMVAQSVTRIADSRDATLSAFGDAFAGIDRLEIRAEGGVIVDDIDVSYLL